MKLGAMQNIQIYKDPDHAPGLAEAWVKSEANALFHTMSFADYQSFAAREGRGHVVCATTPSGTDIFLPFVTEDHFHKFTVGERRLGGLGVQALRLINPWILERHTPEDISAALQYVLEHEPVDLITLGEIPQSANLCKALTGLSWPANPLSLGRKDSLRWLIDLPENLDAYLAMLSSRSRQSLKRKMRKLNKDFEVTLETISTPDQIDRFLHEGEKISRLTYQWHVGQRLTDDVETRARYQSLAEKGALRCYLMSLDGTPRAFLRGTLEGDIYHYETPGFDPDYSRTSIGTIILMEALGDLMENTACRVFDFGTGGDATGYKSTFGTHHILCNAYHILSLKRPRSMVIFSLENTLTGLKNLADKVLPEGEMRASIKRRLRRQGG